MSATTAVCPGTFDPITWGHVDVVRRAAGLFGRVVVAVGSNSTKQTMFTLDERLDLTRRVLADVDGVTVDPIDGLLVDFCRGHEASVVVKGLRFASDFDYELQMAHLNEHVGGVETVFLPASPQFGTLSSTMMRQFARFGADVSAYVPPLVNEALLEKSRRDG